MLQGLPKQQPGVLLAADAHAHLVSMYIWKVMVKDQTCSGLVMIPVAQALLSHRGNTACCPVEQRCVPHCKSPLLALPDCLHF
jgi:hypothetical protein